MERNYYALGLTVFAVYCIWHDAFFNAAQKRGSYLLLCAFIVLAQALNGWSQYRAGNLTRDGVLTMEAVPLFCGAAFLVILVTILLKLAVSRREGAE